MARREKRWDNALGEEISRDGGRGPATKDGHAARRLTAAAAAAAAVQTMIAPATRLPSKEGMPSLSAVAACSPFPSQCSPQPCLPWLAVLTIPRYWNLDERQSDAKGESTSVRQQQQWQDVWRRSQQSNLSETRKKRPATVSAALGGVNRAAPRDGRGIRSFAASRPGSAGSGRH